jgi:hypothetical protein
VVECLFVRASTRSARSPISLDCLSAIDPSGRAAHTFHHILCSDAWQTDGRNDFGISIRPPHLHHALSHVGDAWFYKGALMKLSTGWRADKTRKNRARATRKPKIRWEVLGLPTPLDTSLTTSMEDIRKQVSNMASRGFGQGTRSRTAEREAKTTNHVPAPTGKRRRGATEPS